MIYGLYIITSIYLHLCSNLNQTSLHIIDGVLATIFVQIRTI